MSGGSRAPECHGRVYRCRDCGVGLTIEETFTHAAICNGRPDEEETVPTPNVEDLRVTAWDTSDRTDAERVADEAAHGARPATVSDELAPLEGYFTGDWFLDEDGFTYTRAYVGSLSSVWSGGVEFITGRAALDDIARMQEELAKTSPPSWEWDRVKINAQTGEAHVLTTTGEVHPIERDSAGDYVIGFGWSWCEVEASELTPGITTIVRAAYDD